MSTKKTHQRVSEALQKKLNHNIEFVERSLSNMADTLETMEHAEANGGYYVPEGTGAEEYKVVIGYWEQFLKIYRTLPTEAFIKMCIWKKQMYEGKSKKDIKLFEKELFYLLKDMLKAV